VAQYTVLIIAYLIPAIAIAQTLTGFPIPQVTFWQILQELNALQQEFGLDAYIEPFVTRPRIDVLLVTAALMIGTAGLPHVIIRFYTTRTVRGARYSAFWALLFIALLYTTAPAIGVFAKFNLLDQVADQQYEQLPAWFYTWEDTGLIQWEDKAGDGIVHFSADEAENELTIDNDIMVLANPEIAGLPAPVVGLVAAGGMAAAMSTAAGLLLVISSSASHDIYFRRVKHDAGEKERLRVGRIAMGLGVLIAGFFGVNPPGFVAQVVAFAFGLAASSFFPIIVLGIFWRRCNAVGAAAGMISGLALTTTYMIGTLYLGWPHVLGISPEGIGTIGALVNFVVTVAVSKATAPPPPEMRHFIVDLRYPADGGAAKVGGERD
jgi:cation/acetate symporter